MLSAEKNERLTRVGQGTPMGELLRRYWWPTATHDMAARVPVKRMLLGEDLVLYRDGTGTVGLLAEQCPHRRAALWLGLHRRRGAARRLPRLPRYDLFVWDDAWRDIGHAELPVYEVPLKDERGQSRRDYVDGQDIVAWITQGRISDRSREHLGRSDLGVILLRKLYAQQMERVAREFRQMWTRESSIRYSPIRDDVFALFGDPVLAWN